jgi:hypothetical protein
VLDAFDDGGDLKFLRDVGVDVGRMQAAGEFGPEDVPCDLVHFGFVEAEGRHEAVGEVENAGSHFCKFHGQMLWALKTVVPIHDGKNENVRGEGGLGRVSRVAGV